MSSLPFGQLAPYRPRAFVPSPLDLGAWAQVSPLFDELEARLAGCRTGPELERWLLDWSELTACLDQEAATRQIAMTCHTEDPEAKRRFLEFVEQIEPQLKPREFRLCEQFLAHPVSDRLPRARYEVLRRDIRVQVELFRPKNVPLETEETKLGQQYQELAGSLTVKFRGEEKTLPQMAPFLEQTDRELRREAWELTTRRRLEEKDRFETMFDELLKLRDQIAANAGFANYRDYAFRARRRFDYTPEDCLAFHAAIESELMPVLVELHESRRRQLGVPMLRPWDLEVDPQSRPPLQPFASVAQLLEQTQGVFDQLDPALASGFRRMRELKLLDLENRKGKAPGGYQCTLNEARLPFIFMNAVGVLRDVETMFHEAGHAFHALAAQEENLSFYRHAPIEFCEVASMSMELLGNRHLEKFFSATDADRARRTHLEGIVKFFPWMATIDAFQHWIYTHPGQTRAERRAAWLDLMKRFGGAVDWSGYEETQAHLWHRQPHLFLHPFYYVEYGIAQLGALQVWSNAQADLPGALRDYQKGLALGGSRPLPELFAAAGCRLDFTTRTIKPLVALLRRTILDFRF